MREFTDPSPASWPPAVTVSNRLPQMRCRRCHIAGVLSQTGGYPQAKPAVRISPCSVYLYNRRKAGSAS